MDRTNNYLDTIRNECYRLKYNMVMTVLSSNKADVYSAIKKLTVCDIGIPSQVSWE